MGIANGTGEAMGMTTWSSPELTVTPYRPRARIRRPRSLVAPKERADVSVSQDEFPGDVRKLANRHLMCHVDMYAKIKCVFGLVNQDIHVQDDPEYVSVHVLG